MTGSERLRQLLPLKYLWLNGMPGFQTPRLRMPSMIGQFIPLTGFLSSEICRESYLDSGQCRTLDVKLTNQLFPPP